MAPVVIAYKPTLAAHWHVYKRFLLLSNGAALVGYVLSLLCLYPYPIAATEIVVIFLKVLLLSGVITLVAYCLFVMAKFVCTWLFRWICKEPASGMEKPKAHAFPLSFPAFPCPA